jgi:hypothetical protein
MSKTCSVDGCDRPHAARGFCKHHHSLWMREKTGRVCSVEGCGKPADKRGLCGCHYFRLRKHGTPTGGRAYRGIAEKFIASFAPAETDLCIDWPYGTSGHGYGARLGKGSRKYPHQIVCEKFNGPPTADRNEVAHGCGNRRCINPRHLRWATHLENEEDKLRHGTSFKGERSPYAKLTEDAVSNIRQSNELGTVLAERFQVSATTISNIRIGKTWRHA